MIPSTAVFLQRLRVTLQEQILPALGDPQALASASSMVQVLAQLEATADWNPQPLAERLKVRVDAMQAIPAAGLPLAAAIDTPSSADDLERALDACDLFV